jgi:hypothetical protein
MGHDGEILVTETEAASCSRAPQAPAVGGGGVKRTSLQRASPKLGASLPPRLPPSLPGKSAAEKLSEMSG